MTRTLAGPGQESVWDYPRPPRVEPAGARVEVRLGGELVAASDRALRVLETSHPPVYYLPREDVRTELLERSPRASVCEWKGTARYYSLRVGDALLRDVAWSYEAPAADYRALQDHLAFYLDPLVGFVGGERAEPQPGRFYGGWVTRGVVGPFKGEPGTSGW